MAEGAARLPQAEVGRLHSKRIGLSIDRNRLSTRSEIRALLGGGHVQDYLPSMKNEILAGCFRTELNPRAPEVVLVGNGPRIERAAERLLEQGTR